MLLGNFLSDLEMVPPAPLITAINFVATFHVHCISVLGLHTLKILASFLIAFISPEIVTSIKICQLFFITNYYYYYYYY